MRLGLLIAGLAVALSCGLSGSRPEGGGAAEADPKTTTFDETLSITDGDDSVEVSNDSPDKTYVMVVDQNDEYKTTYLQAGASTILPKAGLEKVMLYGLQGVGGWQADMGSRACNEGPFLCPLPPPPPPDWTPAP